MQEFKVGDWVKYKGNTKIQEISHRGYHLSNGYITSGTNWEIRLWQPEEGEWCWFMNCYSPRLGKYKCTRTVLGNNTYVDEYGDEFVYIEPFLGQLPSFLKDK